MIILPVIPHQLIVGFWKKNTCLFLHEGQLLDQQEPGCQVQEDSYKDPYRFWLLCSWAAQDSTSHAWQLISNRSRTSELMLSYLIYESFLASGKHQSYPIICLLGRLYHFCLMLPTLISALPAWNASAQVLDYWDNYISLVCLRQSQFASIVPVWYPQLSYHSQKSPDLDHKLYDHTAILSLQGICFHNHSVEKCIHSHVDKSITALGYPVNYHCLKNKTKQ